MRIGLDITQAVKRNGRGINRYIRSVSPHLVNKVTDVEATFCIRGGRWLRRSLVADMTSGSRLSWIPFAPVLSTSGLELFHSFGNHLPIWSGVPRTFTIHDFRSLDLSAKPGKRSSRLHRNIERSDGIICLSEHGRSRLMKYYPDLNPACVATIPHGVDHTVFYPRDPLLVAKKAASLGINEPFLLQLGSWFPHKNLELSIRAFARSKARRSGYRLVFIGGGAKQPYLRSLHELARAEGVTEQITWVENVSNRDLPLLVNAASCLLQPSHYEGFALPLLEAMASGVPGVISDSSCLVEVSGGVWPVAGQHDAEAFATSIDAMTLNGAARAAAIQSGLEHAGQFTWEQTASNTAAFFRRVLKELA